MSTQRTIRKAITATVISGAIALSSLAGGAANADGGYGRPITFVKQIDRATPAAGDDAPTEEVAFYYNRIAFNYAAHQVTPADDSAVVSHTGGLK